MHSTLMENHLPRRVYCVRSPVCARHAPVPLTQSALMPSHKSDTVRVLPANRIGSWKLATPGKISTPGTGNCRKGPAGDGTSPHAEVERHATTGRAGGSSEIVGIVPGPAGGRRQTGQTSPETPAREEGDRGGGRQRAVRRTTRAAAERPRGQANPEARGTGALRWGGPGDRGSAGPACRQAGDRRPLDHGDDFHRAPSTRTEERIIRTNAECGIRNAESEAMSSKPAG